MIVILDLLYLLFKKNISHFNLYAIDKEYQGRKNKEKQKRYVYIIWFECRAV